MNIIFRLIFIPLGYIAAIIASAGLIAGIAWLRAYPPVAGDPAAIGMTTLVVFGDFLFLYALIGYVAALPSLAAIAIAEIFRLRSVLYFIGAGLFVAFAVSRLAETGTADAVPKEPAIIAAAGIAGGLVYWLCCGRWSGVLKEPAAA